MKTNWREIRDTLVREGTFSTFNTISHRGSIEGSEGNCESTPLVKSAEMVKRAKTANLNSGDAMADSAANSAESLDNLEVGDSWEWILERAAILECDGGLNRDEANHRAFMAWYRRFVRGG